MTVFAIIFEAQKEQISRWCWGECGNGCVSAIDLGDFIALPCRETVCPHVEREMGEPMGEVDGEPIVLRKLLPVTP